MAAVLLALAPAASAQSWSDRWEEAKTRFSNGATAIKDEVSQWPGIVRELPGAYVDTLESGEQLRSLEALGGSVQEEGGHIPDYVREFPAEYWRSLLDGRQADSIAGAIRGATDRVSLGLLRVNTEAVYGNDATFKDGQEIGRSIADAEVLAVAVAGASQAWQGARGALAGDGSAMAGEVGAAEAGSAELAASEESAAGRFQRNPRLTDGGSGGLPAEGPVQGPWMPGKYGPYHRLGDAPKAIESIATTGELQGAPPRNYMASDTPKVKAYGPSGLPPGKKGFEFYTDVPPDRGTPPGQPMWSGKEFEDMHKIPVVVTKQQP